MPPVEHQALSHLRKSEHRYRAFLVLLSLAVSILILVIALHTSDQLSDLSDRNARINQQTQETIICMLLVPPEQRTTDLANKCRKDAAAQPFVTPSISSPAQSNNQNSPQKTPTNTNETTNSQTQAGQGTSQPENSGANVGTNINCKIDLLGIHLGC